MGDLMKKITELVEENGWDVAALKKQRQDYGHIDFTPKKNKKILLIGHKRHGKDTTAEFIQKYFGYTFKSSSIAACEIFLFDALKDKYGYKTPVECFEDRDDKRAEWHDLIWAYNENDPARLGREIMKKNDIYVGMRNDIECEACVKEGMFDLVIGVFDPRKPLEPYSSFKIDIWKQSNLVIPNAGTLEDLENNVRKLKSLFR